MRHLTFTLIALLGASTPAPAQDFLQSFERFVEEALPLRAEGGETNGPNRSTPPSMDRPVTPSVPTPAVERPVEAEGGDTPAAEDPPLPRPRPEAPPEPVPEGPGPAEEAESAAKADSDTVPPVAAPSTRIYQTACPALLSGVVKGEMLEPVADGLCGERSPLRVDAVMINGRTVAFSSPVTTNCEMAGALVGWVGEVDAYARAALDRPISSLNTGTSMMCRNRYGAEDGFVSEHGFANAVDVTGFTLEGGDTIGVESDWQPAQSLAGKLLRQAHGAACGRFTTVLGPEANAEHEDHFHLDLGCHGQSCTAQICE